jgi:hypothetical protein
LERARHAKESLLKNTNLDEEDSSVILNSQEEVNNELPGESIEHEANESTKIMNIDRGPI